MKFMNRTLRIVCALLVVSATARAQQNGTASTKAAQDRADSLYRAGRTAIDSRDYRRAANVLQQVAERYPNAERAGDALYWRSWALYQLGSSTSNRGDLSDALAAIERYNANYGKNSRMAGDATDLYGRIRAAQARLGDARAAGEIAEKADQLRQPRTCSGSAADDEMRIAALDGLLSMNSEDAVPILKDVLKQRDSCRTELRKRAVWLISQKRASDAVSTLLNVARNDPNNEVRREAIFWLSQSKGEQAIPALDSVLFSSGDREIRKQAVFALSRQSDPRARQALQRAAEDEKMPDDVRGDAIFWLGQGRTIDLAFFKSFFGKIKSQDLRNRILTSVGQSSMPEASAWLLDVARDKSLDTETRKQAIFWASQKRSVDLDQLATIYDQARGDTDFQQHLLFIYSQRRESGAVDKLMAIAKSDPNVELRKQALFWLGQKNDPRVRQFIRDLINK
jgi:HEAT repeat protein